MKRFDDPGRLFGTRFVRRFVMLQFFPTIAIKTNRLLLDAKTVMRLPSAATLCLLLTLARPAFCQKASSITEIAKQLSKSVVIITVRDKNGEHLGTGSGFIVKSDGLIITNYHVVEWVLFCLR